MLEIQPIVILAVLPLLSCTCSTLLLITQYTKLNSQLLEAETMQTKLCDHFQEVSIYLWWRRACCERADNHFFPVEYQHVQVHIWQSPASMHYVQYITLYALTLAYTKDNDDEPRVRIFRQAYVNSNKHGPRSEHFHQHKKDHLNGNKKKILQQKLLKERMTHMAIQ